MQTQRFQNLQTTSPSQFKPAPGLASLSAVKEQPLPSFTTTAERPTAKRSRRKLWDIPEKLLCPVSGTCLGLGELRRIAAKACLESHHSMSEYDLHVNCVSAARDKNSLSIATQKVLEKKYATTVRRFSKAKDEEAVMAIWNESVARGDVPGGLWALTTHPQAGEQALYDAYGKVHMLSHQIGAGQRADLKELAKTRAELLSLRCLHEQAVHHAQHQVEQRERQIKALETRLR